MRMNKTAGWSLATAAACVAVLVGVWLLLVVPQRAAAADSRASTTTVREQNEQLKQRIADLRVEYAELPTRRAELAGIRQALPDAPALAALLDEIRVAATDAPIALDAINAGEAVALIDAAAPAAVQATGEATDAPAADATAAAAGTATDGVAAGAAAGSAVAAVTPGQPILAAIPISLSTTGDYFSTAAFLKTVQTSIDRAFLIDSVSVDLVKGDAGASPGQVTASITGRVFVYVDAQTANPAATPAADPAAAAPPAPATGEAS